MFLCNEPAGAGLPAELRRAMAAGELQAVVGLPLVVDHTPMGVLLLSARESDAVSSQELRTLREIAGNLSFGLQYLQKDSKVRLLSHFDASTGLAKRSLFCDRLSRQISDPANRAARFAVGVIDIQRLSLINDSYGRRIGDLLLQHVADRLRNHFQKNDRVAHFGGGTFAVFGDVPSHSQEELLTIMRAHAAALFGRPYVIEQQEISIVVRSGLALHPNDGEDANALIEHAELALQEARASGARELNYSAEKHSEMVSRVALEQKLRGALERREFVLHYQPKIDFATGRIHGAEALLRWQDPLAGLMSPAAFLPALESTRLILEVGAWVIEQAARDCRDWLRAGLPPVRVAVNISPAQLLQPQFLTQFLNATAGLGQRRVGPGCRDYRRRAAGGLGKRDRPPGPAADPRRAHCHRRLRHRLLLAQPPVLAAGRYAQDRPQLRAAATGHPQGITLVQTVISLARAFAMTTVAEGVETQAQFDLLRQLGCTQSQGYLHSPAVAAEAFRAMLAAERENRTAMA